LYTKLTKYFIMPTKNQLANRKGGRLTKYSRTKTPALKGRPQRKGICVRIFTRTPKKPNSALRKVAKVRILNLTHTAQLPGHLGGSLCQMAQLRRRHGRLLWCREWTHCIRGRCVLPVSALLHPMLSLHSLCASATERQQDRRDCQPLCPACCQQSYTASAHRLCLPSKLASSLALVVTAAALAKARRLTAWLTACASSVGPRKPRPRMPNSLHCKLGYRLHPGRLRARSRPPSPLVFVHGGAVAARRQVPRAVAAIVRLVPRHLSGLDGCALHARCHLRAATSACVPPPAHAHASLLSGLRAAACCGV